MSSAWAAGERSSSGWTVMEVIGFYIAEVAETSTGEGLALCPGVDEAANTGPREFR